MVESNWDNAHEELSERREPETQIPIAITGDDVRTHLSAIVEEVGSKYIYESVLNDMGGKDCRYVNNGAPSCLVGHFLHRMGVPVESLKLGDRGSGMSVPYLLDELHERGEIGELSPGVLDALVGAQIQQDGGVTWGIALDEALKRLQ